MPIGTLAGCLDDKDRAVFRYFKNPKHSLRSVMELTDEERNALGIGHLTSKSTAQREVARMNERLWNHLTQRPLDDIGVTFDVVQIDTTRFGKRSPEGQETKSNSLMWAIGVTGDGTKVPLGAIVGPSESNELVERLLDNLEERGVDITDALKVVDGAKGQIATIRRRVDRRLRERGVEPPAEPHDIQRCVNHKGANVRGAVDLEAIGRLLVADQERAAGTERTGAELRRSVGTKLMASLERARALEEEKARDREEKKAFKEIGNTVVSSELLRVWSQDTLEGARGALEGAASWLEACGYPDAAKKLRADTEHTLALHHLGIPDGELRRWGQRTNLLEAANAWLAAKRNSIASWAKATDPIAMAQGHAALAIAAANEGWNPVRGREELPYLSLAIVTDRHPDVVIEGDFVGSALVVQDITGEAEATTSAVRDIERWSGRTGTAVQLPAQSLELRPQKVAGTAEAVARLREDLGSARAVGGLAEQALRKVPQLIGEDSAALERLAGTLDGAGLVAARTEAARWREGRGLEAAKRAALDWVRDPRTAPLEFTPEQRWLLGECGAEEIRGAAYEWGQWAKRAGREAAERHTRGVGTPLPALDAAAARVDAAATALAATSVLEMRQRIDVAKARAGKGEAEQEMPAPRGRKSPVELKQFTIGRQRRDALVAASDTWKAEVEQLDPATFAALRAGLRDPWRDFAADRLNTIAQLEMRDAPGVIKTRRDLLRSRQKDAARTQLDRLAEIETELEALAEREGSPHRTLAEHPEIALHDAVERVAAERAQQLDQGHAREAVGAGRE